MSDLQSKKCPGLDPSSVRKYVESAVFFDRGTFRVLPPEKNSETLQMLYVSLWVCD